MHELLHHSIQSNLHGYRFNLSTYRNSHPASSARQNAVSQQRQDILRSSLVERRIVSRRRRRRLRRLERRLEWNMKWG
jgi:hypothetical protein